MGKRRGDGGRGEGSGEEVEKNKIGKVRYVQWGRGVVRGKEMWARLAREVGGGAHG